MSDHQRETAFLRQCIRYDDTEERHRLEERITQIQQDERIVRRAIWLVGLLAALAMAGLGYAAVFMADYPLNLPQLTTRLLIKALCVLGAASLICLFGFLILGVIFRKELDQRREDCRRLALKVLELRLGQPCDIPPPKIVKTQEMILNGAEPAVLAPEILTAPTPSGPAVLPNC
ncbi:MAG TPA: hypothetical protein VNU68_10785 [Verrucomicrobiae bacterium]|nr:hypothetical protein [Verrucomicrobiae bacterium]